MHEKILTEITNIFWNQVFCFICICNRKHIDVSLLWNVEICKTISALSLYTSRSVIRAASHIKKSNVAIPNQMWFCSSLKVSLKCLNSRFQWIQYGWIPSSWSVSHLSISIFESLKSYFFILETMDVNSHKHILPVLAQCLTDNTSSLMAGSIWVICTF